MNKDDALKLWQKFNNMDWTPDLIQDIQNDWEIIVCDLHKKLLGKKKKDANKAFYSLINNGFENELKDAKKPLEDKVSLRYNSFKAEKELIRNSLANFAKNYVPVRLKHPVRLKCASGGSYHTQGFGANKYAKSSLEEDFKKLEILGYNPKIKDAGGSTSGGMYPQYYAEYELWAHISEFDYAMLEMSGKFISVLNWAVLCWRKNTNPKVYFPFLSDDDYEKSQVLAYKCDYEITKENMELEPSWDKIDKLRNNNGKQPYYQ